MLSMSLTCASVAPSMAAASSILRAVVFKPMAAFNSCLQPYIY